MGNIIASGLDKLLGMITGGPPTSGADESGSATANPSTAGAEGLASVTSTAAGDQTMTATGLPGSEEAKAREAANRDTAERLAQDPEQSAQKPEESPKLADQFAQVLNSLPENSEARQALNSIFEQCMLINPNVTMDVLSKLEQLTGRMIGNPAEAAQAPHLGQATKASKDRLEQLIKQYQEAQQSMQAIQEALAQIQKEQKEGSTDDATATSQTNDTSSPATTTATMPGATPTQQTPTTGEAASAETSDAEMAAIMQSFNQALSGLAGGDGASTGATSSEPQVTAAAQQQPAGNPAAPAGTT